MMEIPKNTVSPTASISSLPIEILSKILINLDYQSMLEASLVCKVWNDVISSSNKFLDSTQLTLWMTRKTKLDKLTRKYRDLVIKTVKKCALRKRNLNQIECENLVYFNLLGPSTVQLEDFVDFLKLCVNLKELDLKDFFQNDERKSGPIVKLPKLRRLYLFDSDCLMKYLNVDGLDELFIERLDEKEEDKDHIIQFMNNLQKLNSIILNGVNLKSDVDLELQFQWQSLKLYNMDIAMSQHMEWNWQKLIDAAGLDSKLTIGEDIVSAFAAQFLKMMQHQSKITKMKIDMMSYPFKAQYPDDEVDIDFVTKLQIRNKRPTPPEDELATEGELRKMNDIMRRFKNVEFLDVDGESALFINGHLRERVAVVFRKVKHLKIDSMIKCLMMFQTVTYPSLETLEIDIRDDGVEKIFFLQCVAKLEAGRNNPKLRKLILHCPGRIDDIRPNLWRSILNGFLSVLTFELIQAETGERVVKERDVIGSFIAEFAADATE